MRRIRLQKSPTDRLRDAFAHDLNPSQREAASAPDGYNLILAGPGSGKTRVITYRVAYLIAKGVPAESILLVTFTRRAAREMIGRLETLVGPPASQIWAGTFHHIGNRLLRQSAEKLGLAPNFTILDSEDQTDLIRLAMEESGLGRGSSFGLKPSQVLSLLSFAFNAGRPLPEMVLERGLGEWAVEPIVSAASAYERRKRAANCVDYDDLLALWGKLLEEFPEERERLGHRFRHLLVDEMQDTNRPQVAIVERIAAAGAGNLTAVGDDAQSIYRFRGADYDNILKFGDRHPEAKIYRLETNYRSTPEIVAFTNASIAHNQGGYAKTLVSARGKGEKPLVVPTADVYEEATLICQQIAEAAEQGVPLRQMAVLYRNHHDSIIVQGELVERGIPYNVRSGVRFFEQAHIKDALSYLRVFLNPRDEAAWRRLLSLLPGIGPVKSSAIFGAIVREADPLAGLAQKTTMALVPAKAKGHFAGLVADLRRIAASGPESNPAAAMTAVLQGGYPDLLRARNDLRGASQNRLADLEQLAVLAARYESLNRFLSDLILAGDVSGMDAVANEGPDDALVLSTIHQAKGLEWSRVFLPRLIEDGFPSLRSLNEPGGEDEERRIFYVAVTRAMDELTLTYPLLLQRPDRLGTLVATPSRFLTEIPADLYEQATVETDMDLSWSSGPDRPEP